MDEESEIIVANGPLPKAGSCPNVLNKYAVNSEIKLEITKVANIAKEITKETLGCCQK